MNINNYINYNFHFGKNPNISKLADYISKYNMITTENADFLGVADPTRDPYVCKIAHELNKIKGKELFTPMAPPDSEGVTLKGIYSFNLLSHSKKLREIIDIIHGLNS